MTFIKQAGMARFFAPMLLDKLLPAYVRPGPASCFTITTGTIVERPIPDWTVVGSYATGLHGLMRQLAVDLKPLRVDLVSPAAVETEFWNGLPEDIRMDIMQGFAAKMATGKVAQPEDVAESYLYSTDTVGHKLAREIKEANGEENSARRCSTLGKRGQDTRKKRAR
ncbi:hypothetical protein LTR56_004862 [Elasticomyces elasticus]|nr:hypothetical protein LTR56_004862 [Elasticomyces elasticus]KAK3664636.1 hypothetical protein LTR22_004504 [Elasticomyces elasticus]KAK4918396.1 hypothetical protein LTR49_013788 [Elasticomyces elasticus]KAK5760346.1 hypothetical protein LTS12_009560 [Elasticomyces elasticus]